MGEVGILSPLSHLNPDVLDCSTLCQANVCTKAAVNTVILGRSGSSGCLGRGELTQVRDRAGQVVRTRYRVRKFAAGVLSPHTGEFINTSGKDLNNLTEGGEGHMHMHTDLS